jgi:hypothetical protein
MQSDNAVILSRANSQDDGLTTFFPPAGATLVGFEGSAIFSGAVTFLVEDHDGLSRLTGSITPFPELSTWAMMLLGFAGLGFAGYRQTWRKPGGSVGPLHLNVIHHFGW